MAVTPLWRNSASLGARTVEVAMVKEPLQAAGHTCCRLPPTIWMICWELGNGGGGRGRLQNFEVARREL